MTKAGIADLTKPLAEALREEIDRLYAKGLFPRNRADANRHMIRAIQRFMESQRVHIRHAAEVLIDELDEDLVKELAPLREDHRKKVEAIAEEMRVRVANVDELFRWAAEPARTKRNEAALRIRDEVSARMAEADRIIRDSIRAIKTANYQELARTFGYRDLKENWRARKL